ncbi:MAG: hypothetical protein R2748_27940 [Bryobacterales bacterium]
MRSQNTAFMGAETEIVDTGNPHTLGYFLHARGQSVFVLANFSEREQRVDARLLRMLGCAERWWTCTRAAR